MIRRFYQNLVMPNCTSMIFFCIQFRYVFGYIRGRKGWIEIWDYPDEPILSPFPIMIFCFPYFFVVIRIKHYSRRCHVLIAHTERTGAVLRLIIGFFGKVRRASTAFSGNYNPTIQQIIFPYFIVKHGDNLLTIEICI